MMDGDQLRIRAYELALGTLMRNPIVISVDQVLAEAMKVERWLMGQANQASAGTGAMVFTHPPGQSHTIYPTGNGGWATVGSAPTTVPIAPTLSPQKASMPKKADW